MTRSIKQNSMYALFYFALIFASIESLQSAIPAQLKGEPIVNGTAPGGCRNVKFNETALNVTVSWSTPVVKNGSLGGYFVEYRLRERKTWSQPTGDNLANNTVSYTVKKNKTTDAFEIFLTPFNLFNSTHVIKGPTTRIYSNASLFASSSVVTVILALYAVLRS